MTEVITGLSQKKIKRGERRENNTCKTYKHKRLDSSHITGQTGTPAVPHCREKHDRTVLGDLSGSFIQSLESFTVVCEKYK